MNTETLRVQGSEGSVDDITPNSIANSPVVNLTTPLSPSFKKEEQEQIREVPRLIRSNTVSEADTFNRRKKKRKGFFRSLGFERLHIPLLIFCLLGSISFAVVTLCLSIVYPTFEYCFSGPCHAFNTTLDIVYTALGCTAGLILTVCSVSLVICPGALMEHPKFVKRMAFLCIFLTFWSTTMSIAASSSKRRFAIPYDRISDATLTFTSSGNATSGSAVLTFKGQLNALYYPPYSRVLMRIYATYLPYYVKVTDYPVLSTYYVYSDDSSQTSLVSDGQTTVTRIVDQLKDGRTYAIMLLPANNQTSGVDDVFRYADPIYFFDETGNKTVSVPESYVDLRILRMCTWNYDRGCT
ncbi:TNFRSF8 [Acrasis kona]|uniref:TNFRSF8 n=1 Tax=Acrasis kona TaxID=1008807 RepID=A0AAW2Z5Z6_9EUKA